MTDAQPDRLTELGWTAALAADFEPHAARGMLPARVAVEHRASYELLTADGARGAALSGRLRHESPRKQDLPAVGDWVAITPGAGQAIVDAVLPRRSMFARMAPAGKEPGLQVLAANIDVVFLVTSLNAELSLRRLERYLTLAWESGATPVVILSKSDRATGIEDTLLAVQGIAPGVPVHVTSAKTGDGVDALREHLKPHRTGALLGSSGVGKSTLINALLGFERQATGEIREDDAKGRHTTTRRELVVLPGGGILIDTPGMRELQVKEAGEGLLSAFDDIDALAAECGFADCTHGPEPDCAVKAAVAAGTLDAERLESYHKLVREVRHRTVWEDKRAASEARKKNAAIHKAMNKFLKKKRGD